MLPAKKRPIAAANAGGSVRNELKILYARRSAIDTLIRSLVSYDRCRTRDLEVPRQRTA